MDNDDDVRRMTSKNSEGNRYYGINFIQKSAKL